MGEGASDAAVTPNPISATNTPSGNPLELDLNNPAPTATAAIPAGPSTTMLFAEENHDFGTIDQNTTNDFVFKFTNTGTEPLIISNATGSCGCTVPQYPKEPIAPGEEGEIKVQYKPGTQKGNQNKTVTVTANNEPNQTKINITAFV